MKRVVGAFSFNRRLLAWDSYECHTTDAAKKELKETKVDQVIIPGGCIKYIQTPDVCWNRPFKVRVTELYDQWLSNGVHHYTEAGNMKAPSRKKIVEWIPEAWSSFSKEIIVNSFKCFRLNLQIDGAEDHVIHCFQEGERGKIN